MGFYMQDQNNPTSTNNGATLHGDLIQGADILEIERERIKTTLRAIEANEANDLRLYQYHMAKLEQDAQDKATKLNIAKYLIYGGSFFAFSIAIVLLCMIFLGDAHQSDMGLSLVETIIKALAGVATYTIIRGMFNKLTKPPAE